MNLFDLHGKTALVTGSGQGLGLALGRALASAGAAVILNGRTAEKLASAAASLRQEGYTVQTAVFDVTQAEQIQAAGLPPIDILVNNAGIQRRAPLQDFPESTWDEVIDTNLKSVFLVSQAVVKNMIAQQSGKIINISSVNSILARQTIAPYSAAKGGMRLLTQGMAADWARYNIQVNAIAPGYFVTELSRPLVENAEFDAWVRGRTPAARWGQPEELAGAVIFLASAASSFMNGQMLVIDGGMSIALA